MAKTKPHKYTCITKIGDKPDKTADCKKYRTSDLLKYTDFIQEKFGTWVWTKVYSNNGSNKGQKLAYYTKNNPPRSKEIS